MGASTPRSRLLAATLSCAIGAAILAASVVGIIHERETAERRVADLEAASARGSAYIRSSFAELEEFARAAARHVALRPERGVASSLHELRISIPRAWILLADDQGVPQATSDEQSAIESIVAFDGARDAMRGRVGRGLWIFPDVAWMIAAAPVQRDGSLQGVVVIGKRVDEVFAAELERSSGTPVWIALGQEAMYSNTELDAWRDEVMAAIGSSDLRRVAAHDDQNPSSPPVLRQLGMGASLLATDFVGSSGRIGYILPGEASLLALPWWRVAVLGVLAIIAGLVNWQRFAGSLIRFLDRLVLGLTEASQGRLDVDIDGDDERALAELTSAYRRMQRELGRRLDALTRAAERNEEAMHLKDKFLASISHELRTPLTSVCAYAELLLQFSSEARGEEENEFLRIIQGESQRLTRLIDDVLDLTKIEAKTMAWCVEDFDMVELVHEVITAAKVKIDFKSSQVSFAVDVDACPFRGDRKRIGQAVAALLDNAIKFSPVRGAVRLELEQRLTMVELRVSDSGPGIASQRDKEAIFDKFHQRGEVLTDRPDGTGLGLALTRGIVAAHAGSVHCEDAPGGGACFVLRIAKAGEALRDVDEASADVVFAGIFSA